MSAQLREVHHRWYMYAMDEQAMRFAVMVLRREPNRLIPRRKDEDRDKASEYAMNANLLAIWARQAGQVFALNQDAINLPSYWNDS